MDASEIKDYPFVSEGLENRIKQAANLSGTLEQLIEAISTKRYTRTRIQRILLGLLTGLKSCEFNTFNEYGGPQYIKVLGFNVKGRNLLSKIKSSCILPVITKPANFKNSCNSLLKRMIEIDALATDIYVLGYKNDGQKIAGRDFTQNVQIFR